MKTFCGGQFLSLTLIPAVSALIGTSTSRLQVQIPQSLYRVDGYDHRDALFGIPPYGGSIQQQLIYADDTLCRGRANKTKGYPQRFDNQGNPLPWESPFILMVDRGECTFVEKVRTAQRAGAAGVLIADSTCLCTDERCRNATQLDQCEMAEPIMADDGSGADISIPSFLVFKHDADAIKEVLRRHQPVRVEMKFSVPAPGSRVSYELWTTPRDLISRTFLKTWLPAAKALSDDATFTPHEYVMDGIRSGCQSPDGQNFCDNLCTNSGKYCSIDPDGNMLSGASGSDVVSESLRRLCIWDIYGKDGIGAPWWNYVNIFMETCEKSYDDTKLFSDEKCISAAMTQANIDPAKVSACIAASGGLQGNVNNTYFERQKELITQAGVFLLPSLYINGAPVRGELSLPTALKAICAGFASGFEPSICTKCESCANIEACVKQKSCNAAAGGGGGGVPLPVFAVSFLLLVVVFLVALYITQKRQERLMKQQIRGVLARYMPLDERNGQSSVDTSLGLDEDDDDMTPGIGGGRSEFTIT